MSLLVSLSVDDLSPKQQLKIVENFLTYAEKNIRSNYMKLKGTPIFEGIAFPDLINDYVVEINKITNMNEILKDRNMRDHDLYIYDKAIVNNLESDFIDFINDYVEELKEKY